jgi:hypothetical protein
MTRFAALWLAACGGGGAMSPPGAGHVVYSFEGRIYRVAAEEGAPIENLTARLGPRTDRWVNQSPNGEWLVWSGERFDCSGECLVRSRWNLEDGAAVKPGGGDVYLQGLPAISDDGATVVYAAVGGPNPVDLFASHESGGAWSEPVVLTADSPYAYNNMPSFGVDGETVFFDCGAEPYPESGGNDACSVRVDGSGFTRWIGPDALPDPRNDYVQNPHEGDAGLYFEAAWPIDGDTPETIWHLAAGSSTPAPLGARYGNAVSPCVLPDGRVSMLWLGGNDGGRHEVFVAEPDGSSEIALTPGVDVTDIGVGCGA